MKKGWKGGPFLDSGTTGRKPPQPVSLKLAADRLSVSVGVVARAMGALAAVIEEPHCLLGAQELELAVRSHRDLSRAMKIDLDYQLRDGAVVCARNPRVVVKRCPDKSDSSREVPCA